MHNGFINIDGEKMSKSLNNFMTIADFLKSESANALRMLMLMAHYRAPINLTDDLVKNANNNLLKISAVYNMNLPNNELTDGEKIIREKFLKALFDDLNTSECLSYLFELIKEINLGNITNSRLFIEIVETIFGFKNIILPIPQNILDLVEQRTIAKKNNDFTKSDSIRDEILSLGYKINDNRDGSFATRLN